MNSLRPFLSALLLFLLAGAVAQADPADDARYVARVQKKLDESVQKARANRERPDWYAQCQYDLKELEEALPRLAEPARAPYQAKIKEYRPEIEAGVLLGRALNLARRIRSTLDSAREDLAKGPIDSSIFESLDSYFAEPDAKGIPEEQAKALKKDYAEIKAESDKKKKK